jgi:hypothetical protein
MILLLSRKPHVLGMHVSGRLSTTLVALAAIFSTILPVLYFFAK